MPGKITAPLDEILQNVEWGEYKLGDLFNIIGSKSLDSNAVEFLNYGVNFIGRTFENNGIQGKISKQHFEPNNPFSITATVIGNYKYVKYQKEFFYCSQNINIITPKSIITIWTENVIYYFIANIQKFVSLYNNQQGGYKLEDIKNHKIQLPTKNGEIDFDFMENFIAELEAERISELEAYLLSTGLNNYDLTAMEVEVLNELENGGFNWGDFRIGDLFSVNSSVKRFDANKVNISEKGFPYVVRTSINNGIKGFINEDISFLNDGNTIAFGQDTATIFYQKTRYFTGDKIKIIKSKNNNFNKINAQYYLTCMNKAFSLFSWGSSSFNVKILENQGISVPVKNNTPDWEKMELLIGAVQKLVIKDVVLYCDKRLRATRKVVGSKKV